MYCTSLRVQGSPPKLLAFTKVCSRFLPGGFEASGSFAFLVSRFFSALAKSSRLDGSRGGGVAAVAVAPANSIEFTVIDLEKPAGVLNLRSAKRP